MEAILFSISKFFLYLLIIIRKKDSNGLINKLNLELTENAKDFFSIAPSLRIKNKENQLVRFFNKKKLIISLSNFNEYFYFENFVYMQIISLKNSVVIKDICKFAILFGCRMTVQNSISDRCDSLCQNDERCKSGQCILTYCSETVACYKFCLLCDQNLQCFETGDHCLYGNGTSRKYFYSREIVYLCLTTILKPVRCNLGCLISTSGLTYCFTSISLTLASNSLADKCSKLNVFGKTLVK
ncbi:hypothetical protein BpHYR1_038724 [Brachionus plicatilis]|uniref:Uncharacterized protein n=1 Tax=Brachionus plicatilis TaxID=10195 RepID=A0A3M7S9U2_BRAPC|nr:hypothetical protein BpHYR1_038724 [Brachionus plicatilis]